MTIEQTDAKAKYRWQVNEDDNCCLDRKENRHNSRWVHRFLCYDTPEEARHQMLRLSRKGEAK